MTDPAENPYLRDAVMTASPEQLQLMLYDGAIRFSKQARDAIKNNDIEGSFNLLTRAQRIMSEMKNGLRHELAPELCARMAALYDFVFSKLVDANIHKDVNPIDDALRILCHQRETWAILVDKVQKSRAGQDEATPPPPSQEDPAQSSSLSVEG